MLRTTKWVCTLVFGAVLSTAQPADALRMVDRVEHLDLLAREPMVVEHPDGVLFISGYGSNHPALWKSTDGGANWSSVSVGGAEEGAVGNSDVDLAVSPDGTLYFVNMSFDNKKMEGTGIAVGVSRDLGAHWKWSSLSKHRYDDRPWVAVDSSGTAHVVWNDGNGVLHSMSSDAGASWSQPARIAPKGGSSNMAAGPHREIAVRITPASASGNKFDRGVDELVVSVDGGTTWQSREAPGKREWSPKEDAFPPRWVEPLAWDAAGNLFSFWTNSEGLWLARSTNQGETWKVWRLSSSNEPAYYPYLVGRGPGELACTWFSGRDPKLRAHAGLISAVAGDDPPRFLESEPFQLEATMWKSARQDSGGEYLGIAFLRRGGFAVAAPIQNPRAHRLGFTWMRFEAPEKP